MCYFEVYFLHPHVIFSTVSVAIRGSWTGNSCCIIPRSFKGHCSTSLWKGFVLCIISLNAGPTGIVGDFCAHI